MYVQPPSTVERARRASANAFCKQTLSKQAFRHPYHHTLRNAPKGFPQSSHVDRCPLPIGRLLIPQPPDRHMEPARASATRLPGPQRMEHPIAFTGDNVEVFHIVKSKRCFYPPQQQLLTVQQLARIPTRRCRERNPQYLLMAHPPHIQERHAPLVHRRSLTTIRPRLPLSSPLISHITSITTGKGTASPSRRA